MLSRFGLKYPSKLHCEKVASFLSPKSREDAILLAKGAELQNRDNTDVELDFRQESNFLYLTGVQEADFYFIYDFTHNRSYLIAPDENPIVAIWKGPGLSNKELLKKYDVDHVVRHSGLLNLLKNELRPAKIHGWGRPENGLPLGDKAQEHELKHYISHRLVRLSKKKDHQRHCSSLHRTRPHHPHHHGPYGDHHGHRGGHHRELHYQDTQRQEDKDHDHDDPKEPDEVTLLQAMILSRVNKTPIEIALSRESTRITSDAHRLVMQSARVGMYEYQLEALFRYECARQGAKTQAYLPIVGTGVNGAYLHYTRNDTRIQDGQLILIDAACEADCYGSDVTRTFPVSGRFSPEQTEIYNLVLEMQTSVIQSMHKGVEWGAMAVLSQKIGIRGLKRLGIFKGDDNDLFESNVIKVFYPHGLGHLVGLNVHDDGLGLSVQHPSQLTSDADSLSKLPVQFHPINTNTVAESLIELPPPSSRRNKAVGSSFYAKPSTKLEPGMLVTVEPGIYFNPAQIQYALENPHLAQYLDEATIRRYMSVGGVRIEDVVLVLPNGSVENITTAPKDLREVEQIVQEGQRKHRESQELRQPSKIAEKKHEKQSPLTEISQDAPQRLKKRVGVFKKLLRAIRNMF